MNRMLLRLILSCALAMLVSLTATPADEPALRILRISPSGNDVPDGPQIVIQFDRPVVPLGRMERQARELPVQIEPDPGCEWRWIDRSALACQLAQQKRLQLATRYRVVVRPGIATESGATLAEAITHEFVTSRPRIARVNFESWSSPGTPILRVTFDQPIDPRSAEQHLYFEAAGAARTALTLMPYHDSETTWLATPTAQLPLDQEVGLSIEPGIASIAGAERGVSRRRATVFRTFGEHRFLGVQCVDLDGREVFLPADRLSHAEQRCDPLGRVGIVFSSPVIKEILRDHLRIDPDLAGDREEYDPWERLGSYSQLSRRPGNHRYLRWLPEILQADREYRIQAAADLLRDEFDRPLAAALDFRFHTDHRRPRVVMTHPLSVLEQEVDTHLPLVVTNLDAVNVEIHTLTTDGRQSSENRRIALPDERDVAFNFPLRVREWLQGRSGAVVGGVAPEPATRKQKPWFLSQVTPFQVHVKLGHYNSLVWVTDLATGLPVEGAQVAFVERRLSDLASLPDATPLPTPVPTDATGVAMLPGSSEIDPRVGRVRYWKRRDEPHLFVEVRQGQAMALLPLIQEFMVRSEGAGYPSRMPQHGHLRSWGTTAQGIYRAGDLVQYKIWVRNEGNERLERAPQESYSLRVIDPTGKAILERSDLSLDAFGGLHGEFQIPATGAVGWHRFELQSSFTGKRRWTPLEVLVSDFTPAPFRVTSDLNAELFRGGERVQVTSSASLHAGGPYTDAQTRITATLRPTSFRPLSSLANGFHFAGEWADKETIHQSEGRLDSDGRLESAFAVQSESILFGELVVESAVRDDRGKQIAGRSRARYAGRDRFVGIKQDDWVLEAGQSANVEALVADAGGELVEGVDLSFLIERRKTQASRVKGAGNAYLTHYVHNWETTGICQARSAMTAVGCEFTPQAAGLHRVTASIVDTSGRPVESRISRWATGAGVVLWEQPPGHSLQITPESTELAVGDTARFLIQNPFPGARALITVERLGVMRHWSQTLEGSTPIIEFPVEADDVPGFYLSVVVASPRVERPLGDGEVDLGKPAFRAGYVRMPVKERAKELEIIVESEREVYKPGERVRVQIQGRSRDESTAPIEYTVAVLDESVLDLLSRGTQLFDPYEGFYGLESLDMWNYNLLTRLIGIQRFEKKGANPGGGGGMDASMRSNFRFVGYWNPALTADATGRAEFDFELPDNLTGWRVMVMGVTAEDRMGLGQAEFTVNLSTEIRPALPNRLIVGDRVEARFTVMNRTDQPRKIEVKAGASGLVRGRPQVTRTIEAEPFKRYTLSLPVEATGAGEIRFDVRAGDRTDTDRLVTQLSVDLVAPLVTVAQHASTTDLWSEQALEFPTSMRGDVGRVSVISSPTVMGNLEGAFRYMRDYPYSCWEQNLTRGVLASHYVRLREHLSADLSWPEADGLTDAMLARAANYQAPGGGMSYFKPLDTHVSPYLSAYTALAFEWLRDRGHEIPPAVESALHGYLETLLAKDVFPSFYSRGMTSSVRAVALAALARADKLSEEDLLRYETHVPQMDLFGKAHYLLALEHVGGQSELADRVRESILSMAHESAGKLVLSEQLDQGYARILHSDVRSSCAVLSALLAPGAEALESSGNAELPFKLVRTISAGRGQRDRWENTQENLFCMNALIDYAERFEQQVPQMQVQLELDGKRLGRARFESFTDPAVEHGRAIDESDPGKRALLRVKRKGQGRLYYQTRISFAPDPPRTEPIRAGIEIRREYSVQQADGWKLLEGSESLTRGDLIRVDLYLSLPAARNFVVVDDPVPGGLEPVNRELATSSQVDADQAAESYPPDAFFFEHDDWRSYAYSRWSFHHRELRHDAARFYSDYLPAGRYHLSYVAQVIAPGEFSAPPVRAEEMYDPDLFGLGIPGQLRVKDEQP